MKRNNKPGLCREVIVFCLTTFVCTWLLWFPALLIKNHGVVFMIPYDFLMTAGTFVPSLAGFFFAYRFGGKKELHSLVQSLLHVGLASRSLGFVFFILPGVAAVSSLAFYLLGGVLPPMQFDFWLIPVVFVYIFVFMGPLGEEAGWRGFALKRMLKNGSPIRAAVLLGIIWSSWHLPLFFIQGTTQNLLTAYGYGTAIAGYFVYTMMISILLTLLYIMSSGSVLGAMLLHAAANLSLGVVPLIFFKEGAMILMVTLFVAVSLISYGYRSILFKPNEE